MTPCIAAIYRHCRALGSQADFQLRPPSRLPIMPLQSDVRERLQAFLREASDGDGLVRIVENCLNYLKSKHLLTSMKLEASLVGIHPCNRDGYGVNPQDVRDLVDSIVDVGYVPTRVHAVGVEVEGDWVRQWNKKLFESAHGLLGSLEPEAIKITSICGSHTNCALRLFQQGASHGNEVVSVGGKLSMELLRARDASFHEAADQGLTWDVISSSVAEEFPELISLISRSGNTSLQRGEHELQVLRRIHSTYYRLQTQTGQAPAFASLKKLILASKPSCHASVPHMFTFCLKASGGADASFLQETESFVRAYCPSSRQLGPVLWAYLRQNVTIADVKKMTSKELFPKVKEADNMILTVRGILRDGARDFMTDSRVVQALATMDMTIASHVLGIKVPDEKKYKTVQAIVTIFCSWQETCVMLELAEDGSIKEPEKILASKGFAMGAHIRRKVDKIEGVLSEVKGQMVFVKMASGKTAKVDLNVILAGDWVVFVPRVQPTMLDSLDQYQHHVDFDASILASKIQLELYKLHQSMECGSEHLKLQLKPSRVLLANSDIKKLCMVPMTNKVVQKSQGQGNTMFEVQTDWQGDDRKFWLSGANILPKDNDDDTCKHVVVPFWLVQHSHQEEDCNVKLVWIAGTEKSIKIPFLKNTKKIPEGSPIVAFRSKTVQVAPLEEVEDDHKTSAQKRASASSGGSSKKDASPVMKCRCIVEVAACMDVSFSPRQGMCARRQKTAPASHQTISPVHRIIMACFEIVTKQVVVLGDRSWMPTQKSVDDRGFCAVSKWSPQLVKMITGKRLDLRSGQGESSGSLNIKLFDDLIEKRQAACDKLLEEALRDDEADDEPKKKKSKKDKVKALAKHLHLLPAIVDITIDGFQLSILSEGLSTGSIFVEMLSENFNWLMEQENRQMPVDRKKRRHSSRDKTDASEDSDKEAKKVPAAKAKGKAKAKAKSPALKSILNGSPAKNPAPKGIVGSPAKAKKLGATSVPCLLFQLFWLVKLPWFLGVMMSFSFLSRSLPSAVEADVVERLQLHTDFSKSGRGKYKNDEGTTISWSAKMGWKILSVGDMYFKHPDVQAMNVPASPGGWLYWNDDVGDFKASVICLEGHEESDTVEVDVEDPAAEPSMPDMSLQLLLHDPPPKRYMDPVPKTKALPSNWDEGDLMPDTKGKGHYVSLSSTSTGRLALVFVMVLQVCLCLLLAPLQEWAAGMGRKRARTRGGQGVRALQAQGALEESRSHMEDPCCLPIHENSKAEDTASPDMQDLRASLHTMGVMAETMNLQEKRVR
ncbi:unnamed protein product [Symbiodinium sp. CCMP2592]|nr:unnamed protein product [Symbiodinium sp. CCMP2592]